MGGDADLMDDLGDHHFQIVIGIALPGQCLGFGHIEAEEHIDPVVKLRKLKGLQHIRTVGRLHHFPGDQRIIKSGRDDEPWRVCPAFEAPNDPQCVHMDHQSAHDYQIRFFGRNRRKDLETILLAEQHFVALFP